MKNLIKNKLSQIEVNKNIKILYACESGSRLYGLENEKSDYDVRFIYLQSTENYLSVVPSHEVIEIKDEENKLDIVGWDIRKTLRLLTKPNINLIEWLYSDQIYYELIDNTQKDLCGFAEDFYSSNRFISHYMGVLKSEQSKKITVKRKLTIFHRLLSCFWVQKFDTIPPVKIQDLLPIVEEGAGRYIKDELLLLIDNKNNIDIPKCPLIDRITHKLEQMINIPNKIKITQAQLKNRYRKVDRWLFKLIKDVKI